MSEQERVRRLLARAGLSGGDLAEMRRGLDAMAFAVSAQVPVHEVVDERLALPGREIPLRSYRRADASDAALVWFHGGGFVSGTLDAIDPVCRVLANLTGATVTSVGYRLAPEAPYPAALQDCLAAVEHVAARTSGPLALGGDSAGGGLAAVVARRTTMAVAAQVLLCPWLDLTLTSDSVREKGTDYGLTEAALLAFAELYLGPGGDPTDEGASPARGEDLSGIAPTVIVTAEHDPLRDEAERYAERLVAAGGSAQVRRWDGVLHGFVGMTADLPEATEALTWAAEHLVALLSRAAQPPAR